jgi:hypothetical protein
MVKDLELDTIQLANIRNFRINRLKTIDSIFSFFGRHSSNSVSLSQYRIISSVNGLRNLYSNSSTIDQLKHAGGMRLIRKRTVVDSIEAYDQQIKRMALRDGFEVDRLVKVIDLTAKMFNGHQLLKIHADTTFFHKKPPSVETLIETQSLYLGEYLNQLYLYRLIAENNLLVQSLLITKARNLILLIKKEYRIK